MRREQILKCSMKKTSPCTFFPWPHKSRNFQTWHVLALPLSFHPGEPISPFQILQPVSESQHHRARLCTELPSWRAAPPRPARSGRLGRSPWLSARLRVPLWPGPRSQVPHTSSRLHPFCSQGRRTPSRNTRPLGASRRSATRGSRPWPSERESAAQHSCAGPGWPQRPCRWSSAGALGNTVFKGERGAQSLGISWPTHCQGNSLQCFTSAFCPDELECHLGAVWGANIICCEAEICQEESQRMLPLYPKALD